MRKCRKLLTRLGLPTVVIAASVALAAGPAAAEPIIHPDDVGPFNVDIQPGSSITLQPSGRTFAFGTGACVDLEDNDLDGYIDFGPDPDVNDAGCVAETDRSEREDNDETYAAPRLSPSIDENGVTTLEPAGVQFQEGEVSVDVDGTIYTIGVQIEGVATVGGTLDPAAGTGSQNLSLRLRFRGIENITFPPTCAIGPITTNDATALYTSNYTYDDTYGYATFANGEGVPVPAAMAFGPQACGVFGAIAINIALGLGSGATAFATFETQFDRPIRPPA